MVLDKTKLTTISKEEYNIRTFDINKLLFENSRQNGLQNIIFCDRSFENYSIYIHDTDMFCIYTEERVSNILINLVHRYITTVNPVNIYIRVCTPRITDYYLYKREVLDVTYEYD